MACTQMFDTRWHDLYIVDTRRSKAKYMPNASRCTVLIVVLGTSYLHLGVRSRAGSKQSYRCWPVRCQIRERHLSSSLDPRTPLPIHCSIKRDDNQPHSTRFCMIPKRPSNLTLFSDSGACKPVQKTTMTTPSARGGLRTAGTTFHSSGARPLKEKKKPVTQLVPTSNTTGFLLAICFQRNENEATWDSCTCGTSERARTARLRWRVQ